MTDRKFSVTDVQNMFYEKILALIYERHERTEALFKFDKDGLNDVVRDMILDSARFHLEIDGIKLTKKNVPLEYVDFIEKIYDVREQKIVEKSVIDKICEAMMMKETFQPMIKKVEEFYTSCACPKKIKKNVPMKNPYATRSIMLWSNKLCFMNSYQKQICWTKRHIFMWDYLHWLW
jgi:hypothetical protein